MAIWTLETDNGSGDMGKLPVIRTLATLAHDCRRTELFQGELIAALKIVQRGDLPLRDLVGAFAGEIGQTQFLPSSYIKYGVDYDGNGHVDLRHSVPDVLASTANLLKTNGWQAGAPFTQGSPNFEVAMREWNHSEVYRRTIVLMAERIGGGSEALTPRPQFTFIIFSGFAPTRATVLILSGARPDFSAISRSCSMMKPSAGASFSRPPSSSAGTRRLERCEPSS